MHYATHMADLQPVVGASAAVSGVMAAAVRFVFQPGAPLDESLASGTARMKTTLTGSPRCVAGHSLQSQRDQFLGFWFLANFCLARFPCRLAPARRSLGRPISAAFSLGYWRFAGSTAGRFPLRAAT